MSMKYSYTPEKVRVDRGGWGAMLLVPLGVASRQTEAGHQP
jgi:hypothetical protein